MTTTGTLTGTYHKADGTPLTGKVYIAPSVAVVRDETGNVILSGTTNVELDNTGSFSVALVASDDLTLDPSGVTYKVSLRGLPAVTGVFISGGTTVDMADITPVDPAAPVYAVQVSHADLTEATAAAQAFAIQRANHTGTQSADTLTDGTTNKAFLATERTKLAGIAIGATANATDAALRDRSTHTGTQAESTVTNLVNDLAAKADASALTNETTTARAAELALRNLSDATFASNLSASFVAQMTTVSKTANYTAGAQEFVEADASGGTFTVTGPAAGAAKRWGVKKVNGTSAAPGNKVTISYLNSAGTVTALDLTLAAESKIFRPSGSGYRVESGDTPMAGVGIVIGLVPGLVANDNSAGAANLATIQACLDQGGYWRMPWTGGYYAVTGELSMTVASAHLYCNGAPIRQITNGLTLVNVSATDCVIDGLDWTGATGTPDLTGMTASFQGTISASRWCAVNVYSSAHRLKIPWIRGHGGSSVVRLSGWDLAGNASATTPVQDVQIGTILCSGVEFGIAAKATLRFSLGTVKGTYGDVTGATRDSHLAYVAGDGGNVNHSQFYMESGAATNGVNGHAFQIRNVLNGKIGSLSAVTCTGILSHLDNQDLEIDSVISTNDQFATSAQGSILIQETSTSTRNRIRSAKVQMATNFQAYYGAANQGSDLTIDNLEVIVNHTTVGASTVYDVQVGGTRTTINRVSVHNTSSTHAWRAVGIFAGSGHIVRADKLTNVRVGIDARATDATIFYDRDLITLHSVDGYARISCDTGCTAKWFARQTDYLTANPSVKVASNFSLYNTTPMVLTGTITGQSWTALTGTWVADGDTRTAYESTGASNGSIVIDAGVADVAVEASWITKNSEGLILRATDASNYLIVRLHRSSGFVEILKRVAGTNTSLATVASGTVTGRRYKLRAEIYGADIKCYLNDTLVLSFTLTGGDEVTFASQTKHGLRSNVATDTRFDSFRILGLAA